MRKTLLNNEKINIELEDEILFIICTDKIIDLKIAQQIVKYRLEASKGKKYPILSDYRIVRELSKEAREFLASEDGAEGVYADAIFINTPIGSMIANFYLKINKPLVPTKLFTDEEPAKKWLRLQIDQNRVKLKTT